ncbi:MAG: hypothetical protein ACJ709_07275 [Nitrososphaeraceae archaeon]
MSKSGCLTPISWMAGLRTKLYHLGGSPKLSNSPVRVTFFFWGAAYDAGAKLGATIVDTNAVAKQADTPSFKFFLIVKTTKCSF